MSRTRPRGKRRAEDQVVRAAGGVVCRRPGRWPRRRVEVALVHRPKYDDWTFPKGKRDGKETDEETALREVHEETGFRCGLGADLGSVEYRDMFGRRKVVRYWSMDLAEGETGEGFRPNREVDDLRWLRLRHAGRLLTHDHDRVLIERLERAQR